MRRSAVLLLATVLFPLGARAQTGGETFGESIDVRVVNVEAVVTDRKGNRVNGLTAGDFRLLVDGAEVPVDYFTEVADGVALSAPPSAGAPAPARSGAVGRSYLVFIDESLSIAAHRDLVLREIERDLDRLGPEDRMAIVAFDGSRLHRLADWTGDQKALAGVLTEARKRPSWGIRTLAERRSSTFIRQFGEPEDFDPYGPERGLPALSSFENVGVELQQYSRLVRVSEAAAAALRSFSLPPGRRAMIVLSGGWPLMRPAARLIQDANRLGYTLYPVDVPGMDIARPAADASKDQSAGVPIFLSSAWERSSHHTLQLLADTTGGEAAINSLRMDALARAEEDTRSYYWLGFSPAWKADDRAHRIELEVRRPDLQVRARSGFSDLSPATLAEMETESLLLFGIGARPPGEDRLLVEMGEPRPAGRRAVELPVTLVFPASAAGQEMELVLAAGTLDRWGARSDLPRIPFRISRPQGAEPGAPVRSEVTLRVRNVEQKIVLHVRDPRTGRQWVEEAIFRPGK